MMLDKMNMDTPTTDPFDHEWPPCWRSDCQS